jgi:hypothetical protein
MPLIAEIENVLPFIAEMPDEEQRLVARQLSMRIVSLDHARTLSTSELTKLMELALADFARKVEMMRKTPPAPGDRYPKGGNR